MPAIDRFFEYLDYKGLKHTPVEKELGLSNGYLGKMRKRGASIGSDVIEIIVSIYSDLNTDWLITGRGEMLIICPPNKTNIVHPIVHPIDKVVHPIETKNRELRIVTVDNDDHNNTIAVPIVDISVAAGSGYHNDDYMEVDDIIRMPRRLVKKGKFICIHVKGQSMVPTLQDSSFLVVRLLDRGEWLHMPNDHIYVVADTEGKAYVKRVRNRFDRGFIVCTSDNVDKFVFPNFNLQANEIHTLWHVEWYLSARMDNINNNYYSKVTRLENELDDIKNILGDMRLELYKHKNS